VVEPESEGTADLAGEFEERDPFRDGQDAVRVAPDLSFAVALDHPEYEDPFALFRFAPLHGDSGVRVP
jgi:hypothetical protein